MIVTVMSFQFLGNELMAPLQKPVLSKAKDAFSSENAKFQAAIS
jgi:hypothetical protein